MITIIAAGRMKAGAFETLVAFYQERLRWPCRLIEVVVKDAPTPDKLRHAEAEKMQKAIPKEAMLILLDERGQSLTSEAFAQHISVAQQNAKPVCMVIGGAYGVGDDLRQRADLTLAFGKATWPHQLIRVMLMEQLYRAQQILAGHPYHHG
jgi:23S rRNA (pseudouridine1915-N3)-methyltransferase